MRSRQRGFALLKFLLPILFLGLGAGVFKYLLDSRPAHEVPPPREKTWSVQVAPMQSQTLAPEIEVQGKVEAPDLFRAAAPGAGWVEAVNVREGDRVSAGDLLVVLDERDFATALTQAEAELADIEAQLVEMEIRHTQDQAALEDERRILNLTRNALERSTRLQKQALSSESELEAAQRELTRQQLQVNERELAVRSYESRRQQLQARKKRAQAELEQAHRALERSRVVAPYDGVIAAVMLAAGGRVNAGTEMVTMYSPQGLEIRGLIPAMYQAELAAALGEGKVLTARSPGRASAGEQVEYQLVRLAGESRPGGVDGFFRVRSEDAANIRPGGLVTLRLGRPPRPGVYSVPPTAVYDNSRIYLLREGRLAGVEVEIVGTVNLEDGAYRLVRSEQIADGEQLVLTRLPNATTGLKVEPVGQAPDADNSQGKQRLAAKKTGVEE